MCRRYAWHTFRKIRTVYFRRFVCNRSRRRSLFSLSYYLVERETADRVYNDEPGVTSIKPRRCRSTNSESFVNRVVRSSQKRSHTLNLNRVAAPTAPSISKVGRQLSRRRRPTNQSRRRTKVARRCRECRDKESRLRVLAFERRPL